MTFWLSESWYFCTFRLHELLGGSSKSCSLLVQGQGSLAAVWKGVERSRVSLGTSLAEQKRLGPPSRTLGCILSFTSVSTEVRQLLSEWETDYTWRSTQTDVLEPWFLSIIFARWPFCHLCEFRNETRRVLKGVISSLLRIQNYEKIFITFGDTAWNVQKLFGKVSELELIFCTENPIEIMIKSKTRGLIFLVCTEFSIENLGVSSEKFSNNFCTFHVVSPKVMNIFS